MVKIVAFLGFILLCLAAQAQTPGFIDSLKQNMNADTSQDSVRVKSIYQYLRATLYDNAAHKPYITEMLTISRKINFSYGIRKSFSMYVKYYGDRGDFQNSFLYADSLKSFLKNDTSYAAKREMGILYWDMANNYNRIGDYTKAIEYFFLSASVFEKFGVTNYLCSIYGNLSSVYLHTSDSLNSFKYMQKALALAEASSDDGLKCQTLMNYANELLNKGQLSNVQPLFDKIEPIVLKMKSNSYLQYYFYMRGNFAMLHKDFNSAIVHLKKSLHFARQNNDVHQVTSVMSLMFDCLIATNNLSEAKIYLDSTLFLAEEAGLKMRRKEVYDGLATWYEKKGDSKNSNKYLRKGMALNDSLLSEENNKQIALLEMRYQVASKESEIKNLKVEKELQLLSIRQKNTLNYILIATALTLVIISFLIYRNYKQKQKLQQQRIVELETEKQLAATEAVLKGEEQERTRLAKDLHDGLGGMLSGIKYSFGAMKQNLIMTPENQEAFEHSMDMLDSSIREMRRVAHNMMPEALVKFGLDTALRDYCNDINQSGALVITYQSVGLADATLDQTTSITVYRVIQELVANTLKHSEANTTIVQVMKTSELLSITVEDDGKGFGIDIIKQSTGMGWGNIQNRVEFLKGKLDVKSQLGKGTSILIEVPVS